MPSIAIIGAGPAGLTLARLLQVNRRKHNFSNLKITIFENDESAHARWQQGGTLDLHSATGIAALKAAEMWEDILPRMRYEGEELQFADMNATTFVHIKSQKDLGLPKENDRPEIDREVLKQYLLKHVEELGGKEAVAWGKHITSADSTTGILTFRDGTQVGPFDLVVGAEGAWSKIRNVLTDVKPSYSGICGFEAWVDKKHSGANWDKFTKLIGLGSYFAFSKGQSFMAQRMEDGGILKVSMWTTKPASWPAEIWAKTDGQDEKLREALLQEFHQWDSQLKAVINCGYHWRQWPLYELPVGHSWNHKQGWTLIGDSAHLMTPFAGEGVNAAMKDSLELANEITAALKGQKTFDEAIIKFEQDMFVRNKQIQGLTMRNKLSRFRADAPVGFCSEFVEQLFVEKGYDMEKGWARWAVSPLTKVAWLFFSSKSKIGALRRYMRGT